MGHINDLHTKVLYAKDHEELMEAYREWACQYDEDLTNNEYVAPTITGRTLLSKLDAIVQDGAEPLVLDAGCGTGLVGEVLARGGLTRIDALDYSQAMLDEAAKKNVYAKLMQADLTKKLDIGDDTYDAVACVGTFTLGHVGPEGFDELTRVTRPGGLIAFTIRDAALDDMGFRKRMLELQTDGVWVLEEYMSADYIKNEGAGCKVCVFSVA